MIENDIFESAYTLFQDIDCAYSDASIIRKLYDALEAARYAAFADGVLAAQEAQAEQEAEYNAAVEIGEELLRDLDTFFSDDVDHCGSDLTLDEVEEARGPVGNAYDYSEGYDFSYVPGSTRQYPDGPSRG